MKLNNDLVSIITAIPHYQDLYHNKVIKCRYLISFQRYANKLLGIYLSLNESTMESFITKFLAEIKYLPFEGAKEKADISPFFHNQSRK